MILKRHWHLPLLYIFVFGLLAFFYLRYTKPIYRSNAIIQIIQDDQTSNILGTSSLVSDQNVMSKEIELLKSDVLFNQAISRLNLEISMFAEGEILTQDLYRSAPFEIIVYELRDSSLIDERVDLKLTEKNEISLFLNDKELITGPVNSHLKNELFDIYIRTIKNNNIRELLNSNQIYFQINNRASLISKFKPFLNINQIDEKAKTIEISYDYYNARLSFDMVQSVLNEYLDWERDSKQTAANRTIKFIDTQLDSLSRVLKSSKDSLNNYQKRVKILNPDEYGQKLSENVNALSDKVLELDEELYTLQLISNKIKNNPNRLEIYRLIPEMVGKKSFEGSVLRQIEDLNELLETKDDLLREVTNENIQVVIINERLKNRISSIKNSIQVIEERLLNEKNIINKKLNEIEATYFGLPEKKMEYQRLKYIEELNNRYFSIFTEKKIEYELSNAGYTTSNRILKTAKLSDTPVSPNKKIIYGILCSLGFLIGLGLLILRYLTYNDIISMQDLEKILPSGINLLGAVPLSKKKMKYSEVIVSESSKSRMAEAIRSIRSNMSFVKKDAKVIAISSSISGEGKTFVILNLAGLIAANGKKTLVIDLDLRKPKIHHGFGVENIEGMSNLISGISELSKVIQHSEIPNLDFITAGPIPPNPSELIQSKKMTEIIEMLKNKYDTIMIDNPPVGIVSDGIKMLAEADIPLYVFKANYSKRIFGKRVEELMEVQKIKNLNVILNGINTKKGGYGYGYGYGYGSGYGSGGDEGYYTDDEIELSRFQKIKSKLFSKWWKRKQQK